MKENSSRFKLAYASQLLEGDLYSQLGMSGEGVLSEEILNGQVNLECHPEIKEVLSLFRKGYCKQIEIHIIIEKWINHWKKAKK